MRARKRLGQNWLVDASYARRIVDAAGLRASDLVIEIGPGPGALTDLLVERSGHVAAIELDPRMRGPLEHRHDAARLTVIEGDVLETDIRLLASSVRSSRPCLTRTLVVANLPYNISSAVLAQLIEARGSLAGAVLMLQREVVERITAQAGGRDYGALTVLVQMHSEATRLFDVPPGAFRPAPKVVSSVVRLSMRERPAVAVPDESVFFSIVRGAFAHRRKTLENNLSAIGFAGLAAEAGIDPRRRAETLSLAEFAALAGTAAGRSR